MNKKKAQLAYEKLFEEWKVDLTGQQEQILEEDHFDPLFEQYAGKGDFTTIRASDAVPFMRELMDISYEDKLQLEKEKKQHKHKKENKEPKTRKSNIDAEAIREVGFQNEVRKLHEHQKRNEELNKLFHRTSETDETYSSLAESEEAQDKLESEYELG